MSDNYVPKMTYTCEQLHINVDKQMIHLVIYPIYGTIKHNNGFTALIVIILHVY